MMQIHSLIQQNWRLAGVVRLTTILLLGTGLTVVFWAPLWSGGGLVGGDVYSYYFPQKVFFAEQLQKGEFPLWNNRTGFGYPLLGESQTGAVYPFHLLLYSLCNVNTAYNVNHLLHYVLAFLFTALYGRSIGLGFFSALFAGLVYTYGWFPPHSCVEWAIIGGAWLPAALWCVEQFLRVRWWRYAIALSSVLAIQMLAGHFQIAWMTQLVVLAYVPARLFCVSPPNSLASPSQKRWKPLIVLYAAMSFSFALAAVQLAPTWELKQQSQRKDVGTHHDIAFGVLPAWYLEQTVQPWHWYSPLVNRDKELNQAFSTDGGGRTNAVEAHFYVGLVPLVLAGLSLIGAVLLRDRLRLFWGIVGLAAVIYAVGWLLPVAQHLPGFRFFQGPGRYALVTSLAGAILSGLALDEILKGSFLRVSTILVVALAVLAAVGSCWILSSDAAYLANELQIPNPIFGPSAVISNAGIATLLFVLLGAVGCVFLLSGQRNEPSAAGLSTATKGTWWFGRKARARRANFDRLQYKVRRVRLGKILLGGCLFVTTTVDLWMVSRLVTYTQLVQETPIEHLAESPVRGVLSAFNGEVRLFAPGANFPTVLGVASTPVYLTFGPQEYVDPDLMMPEYNAADAEDAVSRVFSSQQLDWMWHAGVTHILSFQPVRIEPVARSESEGTGLPRRSAIDHSLRLVWQGDDPVLNLAWARAGQTLYLYELIDAPGRVRWVGLQQKAVARIQDYEANRVAIETLAAQTARLVLTDLDYPGWHVTIDGQPETSLRVEGLFRAVDVPAGKHLVEWTYEPRSVYWGVMVSLAAVILLAAIGHIRFWHPNWLQALDGE